MFTLKSKAFNEKEKLPAKYANIGVAGGENISPPLSWENAPDETKSFAIVMVDHHPVAREFIHWLVINIPLEVNSLDDGASNNGLPSGSKELSTTYGKPGYGGPRPPAGTGDHPYETTVYALSVSNLDLQETANFDDFEEAIKNKVLAKASLTGMFKQ